MSLLFLYAKCYILTPKQEMKTNKMSINKLTRNGVKRTIPFAVLVCSMLLISCSKDEPIGPDINGVEKFYYYENIDLPLTASSHEMTLSMIGNDIPNDWDVWHIHYCFPETLPDEINEENFDWLIPNGASYFEEGNEFGLHELDWISFSKQYQSGMPKLKISIDENKTNKVRALSLRFGKIDSHYMKYGELLIVQNPKSND